MYPAFSVHEAQHAGVSGICGLVSSRRTACPSAAASAGTGSQKPTILRAKRSAAWACSAAGRSFRSASRMTAPFRHALTPARRAPIGTTPSTRSRLAPRARSTTGFVPRQHHEPPHDGDRHDGRSTRRRVVHEKGVPTTLPQRPNGLAFSGRLEGTTLVDWESLFAASDCQKRPDPAAPLQRRVGPPGACGLLWSCDQKD